MSADVTQVQFTCIQIKCIPSDLLLHRCQCVEGYRGWLCEVNVDECDPNPCVNGASCLDGLGSYTCRCLPGFNGTRCETGTTVDKDLETLFCQFGFLAVIKNYNKDL